MTGLPLLSLVVWTPIVGGLWVLLAGAGRGPSTVRAVALAVSLATFVLSIFLWTGFDATTHEMQFVERAILDLRVRHPLPPRGGRHLGFRSSLLTTADDGARGARRMGRDRVPAGAVHGPPSSSRKGLMVGAFSALDSILFYVFWERAAHSDVPHHRDLGRASAASTPPSSSFSTPSSGSVLMLVALLYLYSEAGSFAILDLHELPLGLTAQVLVFIAFLVAFAVKCAHVAGAHLAARRPRRGADRRLRDPRRNHAEARRLWIRPAQHADCARRERRARDIS